MCTQVMTQMPLSTISTGEQREAELEVAFLEDISEAFPLAVGGPGWLCYSQQGLSRLQGPH